MTRTTWTRAQFVDPAARHFLHKPTGAHIFLKKSEGFYLAQVFKARATRTSKMVAARTPVLRKAKTRILLEEIERARIAQNAPKVMVKKSPVSPPQGRGWDVSKIVTAKPRHKAVTTAHYTPLREHKKTIFERAKRILFNGIR